MFHRPAHPSHASSGKSLGAAGIREALRQEIIDRKWLPGAQLPPHPVLAKRFGVSNVTIQSALNQLAGDGFIEIRPRVGSFVVDQPPHIANVGLVFAFDPSASADRSQWSKYYQALSMAATRMQEATGRRFVSFHGICGREGKGDYDPLVQEISRQRLGGLVFANPPQGLSGSPVTEAPGLSRLEISSGRPERWPVAGFDQARWLAEALDRLAARGCRRVAFLFHRLRGNELHAPERLSRLLSERGMESHACWRQGVDWRDTQAANHCAQLLMHSRPGERPDGLVITDDNLVEGVVAGLVAAGVRVPDDVSVVAGANFPLPSEPVLPVELLGYDLCELLRQAVVLLDRQCREGPLLEKVTLAPQWQNKRVELHAAADEGNALPEHSAI